MPIFWNADLSVGNTDLDNDHQHLFNMINSIELMLRNNGNNKHCTEIPFTLNLLQEFALEHFVREEKLQRKINYQFKDDHKLEHERLIKALCEIKTEIKTLISTEKPNSSAMSDGIDRLTDLLRHWILDHVIKSDLKMRKYFVVSQP